LTAITVGSLWLRHIIPLRTQGMVIKMLCGSGDAVFHAAVPIVANAPD
jgi:hypothetical protein